MKRPSFHRPASAFTLVELLVVMAIIALLLNLSFPAFNAAINKAKSMRCAANLRNIGVAANLAAADNNNQYPPINQTANSPGGPPYDATVLGLVGVLGPYGITKEITQCPVDMGLGATSSFTTYGSSYQWNPVFDDESLVYPVYYVTATLAKPVSSSHIRLVTDFIGIHRGKSNSLFADGHVSSN